MKNTYFYMGVAVALTMIVSCTSKQTPIDESQLISSELSAQTTESLETTQEIKSVPEEGADIAGSISQDLSAAISEEITQLYYCDRLNPNFSPGESDYMTFDTYVCYPKYKGDREQFVKDYLDTCGMYKEIPDGINERDGKRCSEYYVNEDKISFIIYRSWYEELADESGNPYPDCIYCFTVTRDEIQLQGYLASANDANNKPAYQRLYDTEGALEAYVSYEYDSAIPFPIITDYKEYVEYPLMGVNNVYYFDFHKDDMIFDEDGRWSAYRSCLLGGGEGSHHNICDYNAQGKLEAIREPLLEQDKTEHYNKDYSGEILLSYNESGSPVSLNYWYSNGTHRIGSGITGEFKYDDKGRIISWSFINGDVFFVYDGNAQTPWARIRIGGNPYSSYGVEEGIAYGHDADVYLHLPGEWYRRD